MNNLSLTELRDRLNTRALTTRALTEYYLDRIARVDRAGPKLNSVIEVNPDALAMADALDAERREGRARGPLHGLPILVKDNIDTGDKMQTTAGSLALEGSRAAQDAPLVARLRTAGALILGKTNLSEWANFRGKRSSSGWSSRGGQTHNPYGTGRSPSGSSSGSGVAVAAGLCAAAIGTETDGSIVSPANANGIVGLKPTVGLVSRSGIIPISASQDTAGPMTRAVADAALLLGVLAGPDRADPVTLTARGEGDYTRYLRPDGLRGARLGVLRDLFGFHARVDALMEDCLEALRGLGAELVDPLQLAPEPDPQVDANEMIVLYYEFKEGLNRYLAGLGPEAPVHSLTEVIAFNERNAERVLPHFGQEHLLETESKGGLDTEEYLQARDANQRMVRDGIDRLLEEHQLDALIGPAGGPAWLTDHVNGDHYIGGGFSSPGAISGYPSLAVPAGFVAGLPVGLGFIGGAWQEGTLLRLGHAFEQGTLARQPPSLPD